MGDPTSSGDPGGRAEVFVVVLAGGSSTRFGSDKLAAPLRGTTMLEHLLDSLPQEWNVVVVGPRREVSRPVTWVQEDPPGGGPLAGVAAGMPVAKAAVALVVAGDMPHAAPALVQLLATLESRHDVDAAVALDGTGTPNPLLAAYRAAATRVVLTGAVHGRPARELLRLRHVGVTVQADAARDIDTPGDLEASH